MELVVDLDEMMQVLRHQTVQAVVLEAKSSSALTGWLKDHGYAYTAELAAGRYAPAPAQPAPARPLKASEATIERLAAERAKRDGIDLAQAYSLVLRERPELYDAYVNEVTP